MPEHKRHEPSKAERFNNLFDDKRPYLFDMSARHALNYLRRGEIVSTDEEIRAALQDHIEAEYGPTARLTAEGLAWVREQLWLETFVHGKLGTGATLATVSDFFGVSRERVRQMELKGAAIARRSALRLGLKDGILDELNDRDARPRETYQQQMERNAPGNIEVSGWESTHNWLVVAELSGRAADLNPHIMAASKRGGGKAKRDRARGKAA